MSPTSGYASSTQFTLNSNGWVDDVSDYPLYYILAYYLYDPTQLSVVKTNGSVPYVTTYLGQGLESL